MRKVDPAQMMYFLAEGWEQKKIAAHFGVSESYISQRLTEIRSRERQSAALDVLSPEKAKFAILVASGESKMSAAMLAIPTVTTESSAKSVGSRLAQEPEVTQAISVILSEEGLTPRRLARRLKDHVDNTVDPNVSFSAVKFSYQLHDLVPAQKSVSKNYNINADVSPVDLANYS